MSERKIVVPEGMLKAALQRFKKATGNTADGFEDHLMPAMRPSMEAALLWLAENPLVPKDGIKTCDEIAPEIAPSTTKRILAEWQRRMFLAPDPDEPIRDLLISEHPLSSYQGDAHCYNSNIREAHRRGREGK